MATQYTPTPVLNVATAALFNANAPHSGPINISELKVLRKSPTFKWTLNLRLTPEHDDMTEIPKILKELVHPCRIAISIDKCPQAIIDTVMEMATLQKVYIVGFPYEKHSSRTVQLQEKYPSLYPDTHEANIHTRFMIRGLLDKWKLVLSVQDVTDYSLYLSTLIQYDEYNDFCQEFETEMTKLSERFVWINPVDELDLLRLFNEDISKEEEEDIDEEYYPYTMWLIFKFLSTKGDEYRTAQNFFDYYDYDTDGFSFLVDQFFKFIIDKRGFETIVEILGKNLFKVVSLYPHILIKPAFEWDRHTVLCRVSCPSYYIYRALDGQFEHARGMTDLLNDFLKLAVPEEFEKLVECGADPFKIPLNYNKSIPILEKYCKNAELGRFNTSEYITQEIVNWMLVNTRYGLMEYLDILHWIPPHNFKNTISIGDLQSIAHKPDLIKVVVEREFLVQGRMRTNEPVHPNRLIGLVDYGLSLNTLYIKRCLQTYPDHAPRTAVILKRAMYKRDCMRELSWWLMLEIDEDFDDEVIGKWFNEL